MSIILTGAGIMVAATAVFTGLNALWSLAPRPSRFRRAAA